QAVLLAARHRHRTAEDGLGGLDLGLALQRLLELERQWVGRGGRGRGRGGGGRRGRLGGRQARPAGGGGATPAERTPHAATVEAAGPGATPSRPSVGVASHGVNALSPAVGRGQPRYSPPPCRRATPNPTRSSTPPGATPRSSTPAAERSR